MNKVCSFTGHREIPTDEAEAIKNKLRRTLVSLIKEEGVTLFIAGGALGFDTMAALEVLSLKEEYSEIKLRLAIPCDSQAKGWSEKDTLVYEKIMSTADDVVYTSHEYIRGCMHIRNRYMVDNSDFCVAYMTKDSGGTAYTVKYAVKKGIPVINLSE